MPDGRIALATSPRLSGTGIGECRFAAGNHRFHARPVHGCVLVVRHELLPKTDETVILDDLLLDPCVLIAEDDQVFGSRITSAWNQNTVSAEK